jgi:hypothetical protein
MLKTPRTPMVSVIEKKIITASTSTLHGLYLPSNGPLQALSISSMITVRDSVYKHTPDFNLTVFESMKALSASASNLKVSTIAFAASTNTLEASICN